MALKVVCGAITGSLLLFGASLGGGRREISIPRLSLPCWEPSESAFGLGRSWGGEGQLRGEASLCSTHLGWHPANLPSLWQTLFYLILPKVSRLHFACLQRAFLLFWVTMCFVHPSSPNIGKDALQEAPKGAKCNKPSRYKKAKEDSDTQQLWRLNTKCTFHYSEPLLGRAFNEMTYLCGQQCFPFGLILPASFSHLSHCQPSSHSCTVV